jgi:hypothetical protein
MNDMKHTMLTVIMILSIMSPAQLFAQYEKRADPSDYEIPVMKAITYGLTAPSPHNTQSWFIDTLSATALLLYVKHTLPATDPPARQNHMGAGCFIECLAIGMTGEGFETDVRYFPEGEYELTPGELAGKPVARISLVRNPSLETDPLYEYIYRRGTNRKPYKGRMITVEEFDQIRSLTGPTHSELIFITGKDAMAPYLDIFRWAMEIETRTRETNEETRRMFRFSEPERAEKKDGISIPQMGYSGMMEKIAEKSLNGGDSLTWHSEKNIKATMKGIDKGIYSSKGIIMFKTPANDMMDWVLAGRDYVRYNTAIVKQGLVTHPYNQVIQEYPEMDSLRNEFAELTGIVGDEKIQMIVRIGRAKESYKSWRKKPEDYLIHFANE